MNPVSPDDFQKELDARDEANKSQSEKDATLKAINKAGIKNVEATNANTKSTSDALKHVKGDVNVTNPDFAKTGDITSVMDSIKELNLTTFMSTKGYHDMAENIAEVHSALKTLEKQYSQESLPEAAKGLGAVVTKVESLVKTLASTKITMDSKLQKTLDNLSKSIDGIDFNPEVNVPAPNITVQSSKIDLTPVKNALDEHFPDRLRFDEYKAQDLDNLEPGIQYVGFLNPKGEWYIIQNNEEYNTLRYAFGNDSYADFWPKAAHLDYTRLDKALHEVSA